MVELCCKKTIGYDPRCNSILQMCATRANIKISISTQAKISSRVTSKRMRVLAADLLLTLGHAHPTRRNRSRRAAAARRAPAVTKEAAQQVFSAIN